MVDSSADTASGWTELPSIADMARIEFGQSTCQVEGRLVPVAEMKLAAEDGAYFTHDVLLWQEPAVHVDAVPITKPWTRHRSGIPLVMLQASGPGRIAFSHDAPGELIALPLQRGSAVDVREGVLLAATLGVTYDWTETGVWFVAAPEQKEDQAGGVKLLKMGFELAGATSGGRARSQPQRTADLALPGGPVHRPFPRR